MRSCSSGYFIVAAEPQSEAELKQALDGSKAVIAHRHPQGPRRLDSRAAPVADRHRRRRLGQPQRARSRCGTRAASSRSLSSQFYPRSRARAASRRASTRRSACSTTRRCATVNTMVPALLAFILLMSTTNVMCSGDRQGARARHARAALRDADRPNRLPARQAAALRRASRPSRSSSMFVVGVALVPGAVPRLAARDRRRADALHARGARHRHARLAHVDARASRRSRRRSSCRCRR